MPTIKKVLIANRGEIAVRIMNTASRLGIQTVAVFSEADRYSKHVFEADEAVYIGPANATESYLNMDKIIQTALDIGSDAIHPGYGFLSENAAFARAVKKANLLFIGPNPDSIEIMGDKLKAKKAVKQFKIPMVPGTEQPISKNDKITEIAHEIGYPILIKAAAGGGGKGMRVVHEPDSLNEQIERAVSEAESAFGDGSVFIEKFVESPRHIEIQILADQHGNYIHLFERECSIQRRHQKVIEEAPSAILSEDLRAEMGRAAINVAKSCDYVGAGTVEFLVDEELNFYFLEMNTRLQVEHPVTEMITDLDLVEWQIRIAEGKVLDLKQEDLEINGHAIELRVYAEDPENDFLPSIGTLSNYKEPKGDGIRVDSGFEAGMEIPIYYDPLICKLIVHSMDRLHAIEKMISAIKTFHIEGVVTTNSFGSFVMHHEAFVNGTFDTHFVDKFFRSRDANDIDQELLEIAAIFASKLLQKERKKIKSIQQEDNHWSQRNTKD